MTDENIEAQLLSLARAGSHEAFGHLQSLLADRVRWFVRRLIGRVHPDEDDIVQNTFIALYQNLERLDSPAQLRPFLFRVARNQCYDELRRQYRYETVELDETDSLQQTRLTSRQPQPDEIVHLTMLETEIWQAIETLPENQRQTLILYIDEGLRYEDIALVMNVSVGTVKSRLYHARQTLLARLHPSTRDTIGL